MKDERDTEDVVLVVDRIWRGDSGVGGSGEGVSSG